MYTVVWTPRATRQLVSVCAWWAANRESAAPVTRQLDRAIELVRAFPLSGRVVLLRGVRLRRIQLVGLQYAFLYRVRPRARRIEVVAVLNNDRAP